LTEPKGKKTRLTELVDGLGVTSVLKPFHDRGRSTLTVLAYHRVTPVDPGSAPLDLELVSATPETFDWQMRYLRERMQPVSLAQIVAHIEGGTPLPPDAVAVTFDDGFADIYQHAFPILRTYEIPATVFIITGNVDSGEPFWFERVAYLMATLEPRSLHLDEIGEALPLGSDLPARRKSLRALHAALKIVPNARRKQIFEQWAREFPDAANRGSHEIGWPMSWNQVREMAAAGIDFGSHTVTHPNLVQLSPENLAWELEESRRRLTDELQRDATSFAYPFGTRIAYSPDVVTAVEQAGFRIAMSYLPGTNWTRSLARFDLRRVGVELSTTQAQFRVRVALANWLG